MIDIIARDDGTVCVAHDLEDLGIVRELKISRRDGDVEAIFEDGGTRNLGRLQPSMREMLRDEASAFVVALDGWECMDPYACTLTLH